MPRRLCPQHAPPGPAPAPPRPPADPRSEPVSSRAVLGAAADPWPRREPDLTWDPDPDPAVMAHLLRDRSVVELPVGDGDDPADRPDPDDGRRRVIATDRAPWRWVCSLVAVMEGGLRAAGTGWLLGPRTVVTAGHCLYNREYGGWARRVEVFVGRDEGFRQSTHVSDDLYSVRGWTEGRDWEYDYGAVRLAEPARVGGHFRCRPATDAELAAVEYAHVVGYPDRRGWRPAGTLWGMVGQLQPPHPRFLRYEIRSSGGQSGGPVFYRDRVRGRRVVVGIHAKGSAVARRATRITPDVYHNLMAWDALP